MFNLGEAAKKSTFCTKYPDILKFNVKLKDFTSFKIGGNADIYIMPSSLEELQAALLFIKMEQIPAILLGGGTNILIPDEGIRGVVIHTCKLKKRKFRIEAGKPVIEAEAGVLMQELIDFCAEKGLTGLEDFSGLPGTVGGAVFMNARCYEKSISDIFLSASILKYSNKHYILENHAYKETDWSYKHSPFQPLHTKYAALSVERSIIISARFKTEYGDKRTIRQKIQERIADRTAKGHFTLPSAGSTFKNNHAFGKPSGKLIDEAGLRGIHVGKAQVAPWHGNFIVNTGGATASDVKELIKTIQLHVKDKTGFELEPEIIFAG